MRSCDERKQNAFYNDYHHDTMCNHVLAFGPDGKVFYAYINYPVSRHDSLVVHPLANKVIESIGSLC